MSLKLILAFIATIFAIIGNIPYLLDIFKKRVIPHPYTWFIWSIVSCVTFFGQLYKGGGLGAIPTGASEIFTIIIFFFSLQYGFKNITKSDNYFLIAALFSLIPWILTKDPTISVMIVVTIGLIAFIPTLKKTYNYPETETPLLYSMNILRHILILFSITSYNIATMLHSIVMIITNSMMTIFIVKKVKKL